MLPDLRGLSVIYMEYSQQATKLWWPSPGVSIHSIRGGTGHWFTQESYWGGHYYYCLFFPIHIHCKIYIIIFIGMDIYWGQMSLPSSLGPYVCLFDSKCSVCFNKNYFCLLYTLPMQTFSTLEALQHCTWASNHISSWMNNDWLIPKVISGPQNHMVTQLVYHMSI